MCHQHEQDQSGSDGDVEWMNTKAPRSGHQSTSVLAGLSCNAWTSSRRRLCQCRPTDTLAMRQHPTGQKSVVCITPAAAGHRRKGIR